MKMSAVLSPTGIVFSRRDYSVGGEGQSGASLPTIGSRECIAALGRLANQRINGQVTNTEWRARYRAVLSRTVPGETRDAYEYALDTIVNKPIAEPKNDGVLLALAGV